MTDDWSHWIDRHLLGESASVCAATELTLDDALEAYGADLGAALPPPTRAADWHTDDAVWLLPVGRGVIAIEPNGFQATRRAVLRRLSARGRVASCGYSLSMRPYLSFAENGRLLAAFEAGIDPCPTSPPVSAALERIDLDDHRPRWGLTVLHRFTGQTLSEHQLRALLREGVHHQLVPHLDDLAPRPPGPDGRPARLGDYGPLGPDTDRLLDALTDAQLRERAWWIAAQLARHYEVADDPAIARTLATGHLDAAATRLARTGRLSDGRTTDDDNLWRALHTATHPDPRTAALDLLLIADYVMSCHPGPDSQDWMAHARRRFLDTSAP
jgi:hypothetical protein